MPYEWFHGDMVGDVPLVVYTSEDNDVRRYRRIEGKLFVTHEAGLNDDPSSTLDVILESFRTNPPAVFEVDRPVAEWSPWLAPPKAVS